MLHVFVINVHKCRFTRNGLPGPSAFIRGLEDECSYDLLFFILYYAYFETDLGPY